MSAFKIGDVLNRDRVENLVKGSKVYDKGTETVRVRGARPYVFEDRGDTPSDSTYVVVDLPVDLTDRDTLARKLHDASTGEADLWDVRAPSVREQYGKKADFVLENFVPKDKVNTPDKVKDGAGDWWYLATNGYYFFTKAHNPNRNITWPNFTLDDIARDYNGIVERIY